MDGRFMSALAGPTSPRYAKGQSQRAHRDWVQPTRSARSARSARPVAALTVAALPPGVDLNSGWVSPRLNSGRLDCFLERLWDPLRPSQLRVIALGTSITAGHYFSRSSPTLFHTQVRDWLRAHRGHPHTTVRVDNSGMPGHTPSYFEMCFRLHVPNKVDLVLLEFAVMPTQAFGLERLVRRLLLHPASPALVVVNTPPAPAASGLPGRVPASYTHVAEHYRLPAVNLADALRRGTEGEGAPGLLRSIFDADGVHPSARGHAVLARLLIRLFQQANETARRHAEPPRFLSRGSACDRVHRALGTEPQGGTEPRSAALPAGSLPRPLLAPNIGWARDPPPASSCSIGAELSRWVVGGGWREVVEGSTLHPKRGVASSRQREGGDHVYLCEPTAAASSPPSPPPSVTPSLFPSASPQGRHAAPPTHWTVAFTRSYTREWGAVTATCFGGCECEERTLDARWSRNLSVVVTESLPTRPARRGAAPAGPRCACGLKLHVRRAEGGGGWKFKLDGLAVGVGGGVDFHGDDFKFVYDAVECAAHRRVTARSALDRGHSHRARRVSAMPRTSHRGARAQHAALESRRRPRTPA